MVDSMKMWSREYNLGGFRFDLMELHDLETMIEIDQAMKDLDEKTLVFGEPWKGGSSPLNANEAVGKNNLTLAGGVGAFNDDFRDAVKGSVFQRSAGGYLQGVHNLQNFRRIQYGLVGGVPFEGINASDTSTNKAAWHGDPSKTINYVTAHDNNTLLDKLHLTIEANPKLSLSVLPKMQKQANLMVLTAQGVPFLHAGDEILRSKPLPNGGFDHNSYQSPDSVNQIDWTTKTRSIETNMNAYYRGFIEFRKAHAAFRLNETTAIQNALTFDNSLYQNGIIQYTIQHQNHRYRIVHNASASRFVLPSSNVGYDVFIDGDRASATSLYSVKAGLSIVIPANTSMVLRENTSIPQASFFEVLGNVLDVETWIIPTLITVPVLGIGATIAYFFLVKNKKIKLSK